MRCSANGTAALAHNVAFSLGSDWYDVPTASETFSFLDDLTSKTLATINHTPPAAPLGFTNMLLGLQQPQRARQGGGSDVRAAEFGIKVVPLVDAPEGGICKPTGLAP